MNRRVVSVMLLAAFCCLFLPGCSYVSVQSHRYLGMPEFPSTDPAGIEILHAPPPSPHERIGEITLIPQGNPAIQEIEKKLKTAAADMGADAVVIVTDSTRQTGEYMTGPWWDGQIYPEWGRVIVGVAIRYKGGQNKPVPGKGDVRKRIMKFAVVF